MSNRLSDAAIQLLPEETEAPKCSSYNRSIAADPCGTALFVDALVLIAVPLPWPKPVFNHPLLQGFTSIANTSLGTTRFLASVPAEQTSELEILIYKREADGLFASRIVCPTAEALAKFASDINTTSLKNLRDTRVERVTPGQVVLVCTQGSHDVCCGAEGTKLADELAQRAPALKVLRVSHTGGHRFAPTAMTPPDGRMWAYTSADDLLSVIDRSGDIERLARQCRGWWGAPSGPAQVAERALFAKFGWGFDAEHRVVHIDTTADGWIVKVATRSSEWLVEVTQGREIPTVSCRAAGGLPAKASFEYEIQDLSEPL